MLARLPGDYLDPTGDTIAYDRSSSHSGSFVVCYAQWVSAREAVFFEAPLVGAHRRAPSLYVEFLSGSAYQRYR
jgi:hypothetical protein